MGHGNGRRSDPGDPQKKGWMSVDLDEFEAEVAILVEQMESQPEDRHELFLRLHEKLNELRAFGMPVPEDLLRLEDTLKAEFELPGD